MELSREDAQILLGFLSSLVVPFIVTYIKAPGFHRAAKLGIALVVCVLAGLLTVYSTEGLNPARIAVTLVGIFTAAHVHYQTWFKGLGLEDALINRGPFSPGSSGTVQAAEAPEGAGVYEGTPTGD